MTKITPTSPTNSTSTVNNSVAAAPWELLATDILDRLHPGHDKANRPPLSSLLALIGQPKPTDVGNAADPEAADDTGGSSDADLTTNDPCTQTATGCGTVPNRDDIAKDFEPADYRRADGTDVDKAAVDDPSTEDPEGLVAWLNFDDDESERTAHAAPAPFDDDTDDIADAVEAGPAPSGKPAASLLSAQEIAAAIADGDDPFAMDSGTADYRPRWPHEVAEVLAVAQLAQTIGDRTCVTAMFAQNAATVLRCASIEQLRQIEPILRVGLQSVHAAHPAARRPRARATIWAPDTLISAGHLQDPDKVARKLSDPAPLILLVPQSQTLTGALAHLPTLETAPLTADAIVWTLRHTHSATGHIAEDAVRDTLPSDAQIARMTPDLIALAFRADNPARVARKLATLAGAEAARAAAAQVHAGPRLEDLPGLGAARQSLLGLGRDLAAFAQGALPWAEMTSGLILAGPPGTGKTTIAAALARSASVPLIATSYAAWHRGKRFDQMLAAMADAFDEARAAAPCILFIDEFDSLGSRDAPQDRNSSYNRSVINALLDRVDGIAGREGVLIIGATNHLEFLDPALIRPGRLGRTIRIEAPTERDLPDVFRYHLGADLPDIDLGPLARAGAGMSQAQVMGAVQTARTAARTAGRPLAAIDLMAAIRERHPPVSKALRHRIAIHEAGHAVVAHVTGFAKPISATLSGGGGWVDVQALPHDHGKAAVTATLMRHLAGRAAEDELLKSTSGGAGGGDTSDLAQATHAAIHEALSLGRDSDLIWHTVNAPPAILFARHPGLRERVVARVKGAYAAARSLVRDNQEAVQMIAGHLIVDGHLDADDLRDLLRFCRTPPRRDDGPDDEPMLGLLP